MQISVKFWSPALLLKFDKLSEKLHEHRCHIVNDSSFCAWIAEANPEKFNSRFRNKMFYAGVSIILLLLGRIAVLRT